MCRQLERFKESVKGEGFPDVSDSGNGFCCIICIRAEVGGAANDTLFGCEGAVEDLADAVERRLIELLAFETAFKEVRDGLQSRGLVSLSRVRKEKTDP